MIWLNTFKIERSKSGQKIPEGDYEMLLHFNPTELTIEKEQEINGWRDIVALNGEQSYNKIVDEINVGTVYTQIKE